MTFEVDAKVVAQLKEIMVQNEHKTRTVRKNGYIFSEGGDRWDSKRITAATSTEEKRKAALENFYAGLEYTKHVLTKKIKPE